MPSKSSTSRNSTPLDIKAGSITVPILKLYTADIDSLGMALRDKVQKAPEFFRCAPVILDISELDPDQERIDFRAFVQLLRDMDLAPIGVRGGNQIQQKAAQHAKLVVLGDVRHETAATASAPEATPAPQPAASVPAKLIEHPVRSGQRIYAAGSDLVVLSQVSPGAELIADGNIHVYGAMRGRAFAGFQGDLEARIFCCDLQAELISIGGHYKTSENLDKSTQGKPVQVYLKENALIVADILKL